MPSPARRPAAAALLPAAAFFALDRQHPRRTGGMAMTLPDLCSRCILLLIC